MSGKELPAEDTILSASEIGQYHFCAASAYLQRCGIQLKTPLQLKKEFDVRVAKIMHLNIPAEQKSIELGKEKASYIENIEKVKHVKMGIEAHTNLGEKVTSIKVLERKAKNNTNLAYIMFASSFLLILVILWFL